MQHLSDFLLETKGVKFSELIHMSSDCAIPADRINKFLNMLKREIQCKVEDQGETLSVVEELQLSEIDFALKNLSKKNVWKA